jgi:hypothetical protein
VAIRRGSAVGRAINITAASAQRYLGKAENILLLSSLEEGRNNVGTFSDQISWLGFILRPPFPVRWNQWHAAFVPLTVAGRREIFTPLP